MSVQKAKTVLEKLRRTGVIFKKPKFPPECKTGLQKLDWLMSGNVKKIPPAFKLDMVAQAFFADD